MKTRNIHFTLASFLALLLLLCFACATQKGATEGQKPEQKLAPEEKSRQQWEQRVVQSPWLISSDYFRQKGEAGTLDLNKWWKERQKYEARQKKTEERLAELEKEIKKSQQPAAPAGTALRAPPSAAPSAPAPAKPESRRLLRFKVAMVIMPAVYQAAPGLRYTLLRAAGRQFAGHPGLLLIGADQVEDILVQQHLVPRASNKVKIARALGIYPAARLVLFVDRLALAPRDSTMQGGLAYSIVDGFSGTPVSRGQERGSVPAGSNAPARLLQQLLGRMATELAYRRAGYAWYSRIAMVEGKRVYLSAGEASGLKPGDILAVYGPGREIIHPVARVSMGFEPGPYKGRVKVVKLFGRDAAAAAILAGQARIEPNDLVTIP